MKFGQRNELITQLESDEKASLIRSCESYERVKNQSFPGVTPEIFGLLKSFEHNEIIGAFNFLKYSTVDHAEDGVDIHFRTYERADLTKRFLAPQIGKHFAGKKITWRFFRSLNSSLPLEYLVESLNRRAKEAA